MNQNFVVIDEKRAYLKEELKGYIGTDKEAVSVHKGNDTDIAGLKSNYESAESSSALVKEIVSVPARDGNLYMTIRDAAGAEIRLNSSYRPLDEADKWAKQYEIKDLGAVVSMFGFGNGYCVRALLARLGKDAKLIILEPEKEVFAHTLMNYDISDILADERVELSFFKECARDFIKDIAKFVHWMNAGAQVQCIHPQYDKCYEQELAVFRQIIKENNERIYVNRNTEVIFGAKIVENVLKNTKYIKEAGTLDDLRKIIPVDVPAIIVAAGPSLDLNVDLLKEAKGRVFILATDTALRTLKKHDVVPDAAVTIDPEKTLSFFDNAGFENIPLFFNIKSNPEALVKNKDKKILFGFESYTSEKFAEYGKSLTDLDAGGSVATAAFSICRALGFKRIVFIGQDLAYKGEVTHAGGEINTVRNEEGGIRYVEAVDGSMIKTRHDWFLFMKWFEGAAAECKEEGTEIIDATEGGALIKGTVLMTLKEVIDKYCVHEHDFMEIIRGLAPAFDENTMKKLEAEYTADERDILFLKERAAEGVTYVKKAVNEYRKYRGVNQTVENMIAKISKINKDIISKNIYKLMEGLVKVENYEKLQNSCKFSGDVTENTLKLFDDELMLLEGTVSAATKLKGMVEKYRNENGGSLC